MPRIASIKSIRAQIAALEAKAKKIETAQKPGVAQVLALMKKYKLKVADLSSAPKSTKKAAKKSATKKTKKRSIKKAAVKYRDDNGNTWSGRGLTPKWLKAAEKAGQKRDTFLV